MHAPLSILPPAIPGVHLAWVILLAVVGVVLWISGAVWSRSLVTLILVAAGTWIGLRLPGWCRWHIDGMAIGIGAAIGLGASGYLMHRMWIGLALAGSLAVMMAGAGAVTWNWMHPQQETGQLPVARLDAPRENVSFEAVSLSAIGPIAAVGTISQALDSHPRLEMTWTIICSLLRLPSVRFILGSALIGFLAGGMIAVRWNRFSIALVWSWVGLSMALTMGMLAVLQTRPAWLLHLPSSGETMLAGVAGLLIVGTAVQYYLAGRGPAAAGSNDDGGH